MKTTQFTGQFSIRALPNTCAISSRTSAGCFPFQRRRERRGGGIGLQAMGTMSWPVTLRTENEGEIVIECGTEGGSWPLVGSQGASGWKFRVVRDEGALLDFMDEEDREGFEPWEESIWVEGWEATPALFQGVPMAGVPPGVSPALAARYERVKLGQ